MRLLTALKKARSMPWGIVARRLRHELPNLVSKPFARRRDRTTCTFAPAGNTVSLCPLFSDTPEIKNAVTPTVALAPELIRHYLGHEFNLLGSGWVNLRHGAHGTGFCGVTFPPQPTVTTDPTGEWLTGRVTPSNLAEAQRRWRLINDPAYAAIDWQLDFRSGYRWDETTWHRDIDYGHRRGVDIKVPWDMARMHHLPQLAWEASRPGTSENDRTAWSREFRNMVLDFLATNPPRFGVNWACTMDVAIRAANWALAYSLFRRSGITFDSDFERTLAQGLLEHGRHIVRHLEWRPDFRANHYLADITGLLFIAAALSRSPETDAWLAFAAQELREEFRHQFHPDGSNVEGSVCYHRLSGEMAAFGVALLLGLDEDRRDALAAYDHRQLNTQPPLRPAPLLKKEQPLSGSDTAFLTRADLIRLAGIAQFTQNMTHADGHVAQIGDNDNGRFFLLSPSFQTVRTPGGGTAECDEQLDHAELVEMIASLFSPVRLDTVCPPAQQDICLRPGAQLVRLLSRDRFLSAPDPASLLPTPHPAPSAVSLLEWKERLSLMPQRQEHRLPVKLPQPRFSSHPDFGAYAWRTAEASLILRCGPLGLYGLGGHSHHDQLSLTLHAAGRDLIRDSGTFTYTADLDERNRYRSVRAHFAPWLAENREPGNSSMGPFLLGNEAKAECLYAAEDGFVGRHVGYGPAVYRWVWFDETGITIIDALDAPASSGTGETNTLARLPLTEDGEFLCPVPHSPCYGVAERPRG